MNVKLFSIIASVLGFFGVIAGAFGGHALKNRLSPDMLNVYEVAVRYQIYHVFALFAVAWLSTRYSHSFLNLSGWLFFLGIIVFSGSLYILSLSGMKIWGAVTPIGGVMFLAAWLMLALGTGFISPSMASNKDKL